MSDTERTQTIPSVWTGAGSNANRLPKHWPYPPEEWRTAHGATEQGDDDAGE